MSWIRRGVVQQVQQTTVIRIVDSGQIVYPIPYQLVGGPSSGFQAAPQLGDPVQVLYTGGAGVQKPVAFVGSADVASLPAAIGQLRPGESRQVHPDGRIVNYLANTLSANATGITTLYDDSVINGATIQIIPGTSGTTFATNFFASCQLSGHWLSTNYVPRPTAVPEVALGTLGTPPPNVVVVTGGFGSANRFQSSDTKGRLILHTGSTAPGTGLAATITFGTPYGSSRSPVVLLAPIDAAAQGVGAYTTLVTSSADCIGFTIQFTTAPAPNLDHNFIYLVIGG